MHSGWEGGGGGKGERAGRWRRAYVGLDRLAEHAFFCPPTAPAASFARHTPVPGPSSTAGGRVTGPGPEARPDWRRLQLKTLGLTKPDCISPPSRAWKMHMPVSCSEKPMKPSTLRAWQRRVLLMSAAICAVGGQYTCTAGASLQSVPTCRTRAAPAGDTHARLWLHRQGLRRRGDVPGAARTLSVEKDLAVGVSVPFPAAESKIGAKVVVLNMAGATHDSRASSPGGYGVRGTVPERGSAPRLDRAERWWPDAPNAATPPP